MDSKKILKALSLIAAEIERLKAEGNEEALEELTVALEGLANKATDPPPSTSIGQARINYLLKQIPHPNAENFEEILWRVFREGLLSKAELDAQLQFVEHW
ncbi:MAG: hypothetical protein VKK04_25685 [Synechococcales bacterium]|nr:hypothetical protein [Synechococcales bacterium]